MEKGSNLEASFLFVAGNCLSLSVFSLLLVAGALVPSRPLALTSEQAGNNNSLSPSAGERQQCTTA